MNTKKETTQIVSIKAESIGDLTELERYEVGKENIDKLLESMSYKHAYIYLAVLEDILKKMKDIIKEKTIVNTDKDEWKGHKIEIVSKASRWVYKDEFIDSLEKTIEERKNLLKTIKKEMVDPSTGELIIPATKEDTGLTVKVTLKK